MKNTTISFEQLTFTDVFTQVQNQKQLIPFGNDGKFTLGDGFCGMGGVSDGFARNENIEPVFGINHSPKAIKCYKENNPGVKCYEEDWETMDEKKLPRQLNFFWMSAECTHHSVASGGNSRDPKSRSLADHLERYVIWCNPDYIFVENVREFLSWGPVEEKIDTNGNVVMKYNKEFKCMMPVLRPIKHLKKIFYNRWVKSICDLGYTYEYRLINAADFGAATSRVRYFGLFAKKGLKIIFPSPTHSKYPNRTGLKPWIACKTVIDLENEGNSIFGREYNMELPKNVRRKLAKPTLQRFAYGIKKFVLNDFISKSYSSNGNGIDVSSLEDPLHAIRTKDCHAYIKLLIDEEKRFFLTQNIQKSNNANSIDQPLNTILTRDEKVLCSLQFIDKDNQNKYNVQSINEPLSGIVCADSKKLITLKTKGEIDKIKEQEKREFIEMFFGVGILADLLCDIIKDIKMRYLNSNELAKASGFNNGMSMGDSESERKLHIGNAVPPVIPEAWSYAITA